MDTLPSEILAEILDSIEDFDTYAKLASTCGALRIAVRERINMIFTVDYVVDYFRIDHNCSNVECSVSGQSPYVVRDIFGQLRKARAKAGQHATILGKSTKEMRHGLPTLVVDDGTQLYYQNVSHRPNYGCFATPTRCTQMNCLPTTAIANIFRWIGDRATAASFSVVCQHTASAVRDVDVRALRTRGVRRTPAKPAAIFTDLSIYPEEFVRTSGGAKEWRRNGVLHRGGDLPARVTINGIREWYTCGVLHRENGLPARIYTRDEVYDWFIRGVFQHRLNARNSADTHTE